MKLSRFPHNLLRPNETIDEFMNGRLRLIQSKNGYRFSIDAVLVSEFVSTKPGDIVVDLGAGCGVISLLLLLTRDIAYAVGIEIQPDLADQARRNAALNGFSNKMGIVLADIRSLPLAPCIADVIVCNPPYRRKNSGRVNPDLQRAIARHELKATLDDIVESSERILKPGGKLAIIYPAGRLVDLLVRMRSLGLEPKRARVIYPTIQSESKMVLVEVNKGGKAGLKILPPLVGQGDFFISS
ncbi:MAG: methyltransferase [Deltaproteobacteria bacterium]|nr:methyltransferase [Deltaproteobacteria bacterium]MBW1919270.1 methyltransferase [Deltaproteobacteria bacterium]MBW1935091.1 methyltransferase [Deltaproteobacteria bacterium]